MSDEQKVIYDPLLDNDQSLVSNSDEAEKKNDEVDDKFTKRSPLVTLLLMTIGPLSLTARSLFDIIETSMISKGYKNRDPDIISVIGYAAVPMQIMVFFPMYFANAITTKVTYLIGHGKHEVAKYVVADVFKTCFLSSFLFAGIFYFIEGPLLKFTGCTGEIYNKTFDFSLVELFSIPIVSLAFLCTFFLQSIGKSGLSAIVQFLSAGFQALVLAPLFIYLIKIKATFMRFTYVIAISIVGIIFTTLIFKGKFALKINVKMMFDGFQSETLKALILALPSLVQFISLVVPPMFILNSATSVDKSKSSMIGAAQAASSKVLMLVMSLPGAIGSAFLSAGSHSYGKKDYERLFKYLRLTYLIAFIIIASIFCLVFGFTKQIVKVFINNPDYAQFAIKYVRIPFYSVIVHSFVMPTIMFLVVIGKPYYTIFISLLQTIILSAGSKIIASKTTEAHHVLYIYNISDCLVFVIYLIIFILSYIKLKKNIQNGINK